MTFNSELTNSAFNVLLDMTNLKDSKTVDSKKESSVNQAQKSRVETSSSSVKSNILRAKLTRKPADPVIYYSNGQDSMIISKENLLDKICQNPQSTHLLWTRGESKWRSWEQLSSLKKAVEAKLQLSKPQEAASSKEKSVHVSKKRMMVNSHNSMVTQSKNSPSPRMQKPEVSKKRGDKSYLSVPETIFTRFSIDLDPKLPLKVFVGLDSSLEKGGLFIPTERVLHVGDYIQVRLNIRGKTFLKFEAPITWLRVSESTSYQTKTKNNLGSFEQGVAVYWPKLTDQQAALLKKVTNVKDYELYVA